VSTRTSLLLAIGAFVLIATANSGGYRYGVSDQAFYVPAIAMTQAPELFPRDRRLLEPQMRAWAGDELFGTLALATGGHLPSLFALLYVLTLVMLALGAVALARSIGCSWWAVATFLVLLTLRHRIARTGANSLEGYFHPRMLAFALGLFALASVARTRLPAAALWTAAAAVVHTTTAIWFGGVLGMAAIWPWRRSSRLWMGLLFLLAAALWMANERSPDLFERMTADWLNVLSMKDYLFASQWPAYAWVTNLAYPAVIGAVYLMRRRQQVTARGEAALVGGLMALVLGFLISVPLADAHVAIAVQMQVNRIFWLLDAVVALYLAWWLVDRGSMLRRPSARRAVVALLLLFAVARGFYVLRIEAQRPFAVLTLPDTAWIDVMRWIGRQPEPWHVLADPAHGWRHGYSVRVAARRDTLVEDAKDTAMALYDRGAAHRVLTRLIAVGTWEALTPETIRALDAQFDLDVMVDTRTRTFDFPVLYRNEEFVVYDLQ
jgi:hypothetical protein